MKEFFLLFVSFNPFPLSLFLSSPNFSRALSSLDARFSTIFWRKRGDYSQSNVFNLVQPSSLTQKVFYPMTFVWMFGNLQGQLRKCTQFFWQNSKRLICDRYLTFLEYRNRWRRSFALWSAQNSSFLIFFFWILSKFKIAFWSSYLMEEPSLHVIRGVALARLGTMFVSFYQLLIFNWRTPARLVSKEWHLLAWKQRLLSSINF